MTYNNSHKYSLSLFERITYAFFERKQTNGPIFIFSLWVTCSIGGHSEMVANWGLENVFFISNLPKSWAFWSYYLKGVVSDMRSLLRSYLASYSGWLLSYYWWHPLSISYMIVTRRQAISIFCDEKSRIRTSPVEFTKCRMDFTKRSSA